jgi:hypothetical protein
MNSCTPARPRARSERRNAVHNAPSSLSPTSNPRTSRCPSAATPVATTTAWETTREQRLTDPPPPLQQRREERPAPQPGDLQLQVPGRGGDRPRPAAVALGGAGLGALVRVRADHRGELGLDQRLADRLGGLPDPVINLGGFEYFQHFEQGRLV